MNTENNKLIAEFMGYRMNDKGENDYAKTFLIDIEGKRFAQLSALKYHTSWDWLMPVVEKIESCHYKTFRIVVSIHGSGAYIGVNPSDVGGNKFEGKKEIANTLNINYFINPPEIEYTKIEGVYAAVVQFIQWYNQQNPHP